MKVYIAGPYSKGDQAMNVQAALEAAEAVLAKGHTPFVPHLFHFWHLRFPHPWETWIEMDKEWLPLCDIMLMLPGWGKSKGACLERNLALELKMPIAYEIEQIG